MGHKITRKVSLLELAVLNYTQMKYLKLTVSIQQS